MRVRLLDTVEGNEQVLETADDGTMSLGNQPFRYEKGKEVDVSDALGKKLVAQGHAEEVS